MKTRNLFFAFVALLVSATVFATDTPKTGVLSAQGNKILVNYESEKPCLFEVTITDGNGVILHEWKAENPQTNVKQLINLQKLEDGKYQLCLKSGIKSLNSTLNLDGETVEIGPIVERCDPYFEFKDNKLYLSFMNQPLKHVYVNVYNNGEHYTGFDLGKDFIIQKCFDFSMAKKGTYEIVLSENFNSHNFTVTK